MRSLGVPPQGCGACAAVGVPKETQVEALQKFPHILVATPGRLLDLVDDGLLKLEQPGTAAVQACTWMHDLTHANACCIGHAGTAEATAKGVQLVVLDEVDKMLSIGFAPQLQRLRHLLIEQSLAPASASLQKLGGKKPSSNEASRPQVMLFTATLPEEVAQIAAQWLRPGALKVRVTSSGASISKTITQVGRLS